ncbi:MAG: flagellar basal body P-ring formation chaperone FlgA [Beijerinckiaceae bacterium]
MNRKIFRSVALFAFFTGASILSIIKADAQTRPSLRAHAVISGDVVTLGDLVANAGAASSRAMFRAPQIGETGTIQALRVVSAARDAGLMDIETRGISQIVVERAGRRASRQDIEDALADVIAQRTRIDSRDLTFVLDTEPMIAMAMGARTELMVSDLVLDARNRRFNAVITPAASQNGVRKTARISGSYSETVLVPVLSRHLQKGDAIRNDDFQMERREKDLAGDDAVTDAKSLLGRVARNAMRAGLVLRDRDLVRPIAVERNAMITMHLDVPGIQLTMKGKALDQGSIGEMISVQNLTSKRTVQGMVIGAGQVRIGENAAGAARTATIVR